MKDLWRALALAWLGGMASPALTDDLSMSEAAEERRAEAVQSSCQVDGPGADGIKQASQGRHQQAIRK